VVICVHGWFCFLPLKKITKRTQFALCLQRGVSKTNPNEPNILAFGAATLYPRK